MSKIDNSLFQMQILLVDAKKRNAHDSIVQAFEDSVKALEQQPCEDCVSRKDVLDMATTIQTDDFSGNEIIEVVDVDDIKELPSVTLKAESEEVEE